MNASSRCCRGCAASRVRCRATSTTPTISCSSAVERALRNLDQFRPARTWPSWMFGIMKNAWIDDLRARARRGEVALPEDSGEHPAVSPVDTDASLWSVSEAMNKLPEDQRLAVALVLVEGMSYKEAAAVLEIPIGTLTSRLARGRTALAAALSEKQGIRRELRRRNPHGLRRRRARRVQTRGDRRGHANAIRGWRIACSEHRALRAEVAGAFSPVLDQPMPERLLARRRRRRERRARNVLQFPARIDCAPSPPLASARMGGDGGQPGARRAAVLAIARAIASGAGHGVETARWWRAARSRARSTHSWPAHSGAEARCMIGLTFKAQRRQLLPQLRAAACGDGRSRLPRAGEWRVPVTASAAGPKAAVRQAILAAAGGVARHRGADRRRCARCRGRRKRASAAAGLRSAN